MDDTVCSSDRLGNRFIVANVPADDAMSFFLCQNKNFVIFFKLLNKCAAEKACAAGDYNHKFLTEADFLNHAYLIYDDKMNVADGVRYERMRKRLRKKEEKVGSTRRYLEGLREKGYSKSLPAYEKAINAAEREATYARRDLNVFEREHDLPISVAKETRGGAYGNLDSPRYEKLKQDFYAASDEYEVTRREYNDMLRSGRTNLSVMQGLRVANNKVKLAQSKLLAVEDGIPASVAKLRVDEAERELSRSIEIMRRAPITGTSVSRPRAVPTMVRDFSGNLMRTELSTTQINVLEAARKKLAEGNYTTKEIAKEAGVPVNSVGSIIWKLRQQGIDIPNFREARAEEFRKAVESEVLEEEKHEEMRPKTVESPIIEEAAKEEIAEPVKSAPKTEMIAPTAGKLTELTDTEDKVYLAFGQLSASGQELTAKKIASIAGVGERVAYAAIYSLKRKGLIPATDLRKYNLELTGRHFQPISAKGLNLPDIVLTQKMAKVYDAYDYLKTTGKQISTSKISEMTDLSRLTVQTALQRLKKKGLDATIAERTEVSIPGAEGTLKVMLNPRRREMLKDVQDAIKNKTLSIELLANKWGMNEKSISTMLKIFRNMGISVPNLVRKERVEITLENGKKAELSPAEAHFYEGVKEWMASKSTSKEELAKMVGLNKNSIDTYLKILRGKGVFIPGLKDYYSELKLSPIQIDGKTVLVTPAERSIYTNFEKMRKSGFLNREELARETGFNKHYVSLVLIKLRNKGIQMPSIKELGMFFRPIKIQTEDGRILTLTRKEAEVYEGIQKLAPGKKVDVSELSTSSGLKKDQIYNYLYRLRKKGVEIPHMQEWRLSKKQSKQIRKEAETTVEKNAMIEAEKRVQRAFNHLASSGQEVSAEKIAAVTGDKVKNVYYCIRRLKTKGLIPSMDLRRYNLESTGRHLQPLSARGKDLPETVISSKAGNVLDAYGYLKTIGERPDIQKISKRTGMSPKAVQTLLFSLKREGLGVTTFRKIRVGKAGIADLIKEHGLHPEQLLSMQDEWIREEEAKGQSGQLKMLRRERELSGPLARRRGRARKTAA